MLETGVKSGTDGSLDRNDRISICGYTQQLLGSGKDPKPRRLLHVHVFGKIEVEFKNELIKISKYVMENKPHYYLFFLFLGNACVDSNMYIYS